MERAILILSPATYKMGDAIYVSPNVVCVYTINGTLLGRVMRSGGAFASVRIADQQGCAACSFEQALDFVEGVV